MLPPTGSPLKSKLMSMYLPKREELSFLLVLALPNVSRIAFDCSSTFFTLHKKLFVGIKTLHKNELILFHLSISCCPPALVTAAMYFIIIFDASVFPLPDSPLMTMQVSLPCCFITLWAESAMANMWGGFSKISRPGK
jgi:hypothetical protein